MNASGALKTAALPVTGDKLVVTSQDGTASEEYDIRVRNAALTGRLDIIGGTVQSSVTQDIVLEYYAGQRTPEAAVNIYLPAGINARADNTYVNLIGRGEVKLSDFSGSRGAQSPDGTFPNEAAHKLLGRFSTDYKYQTLGDVRIIDNADGSQIVEFTNIDLRPNNGQDIVLRIEDIKLTTLGEYNIRADLKTKEPAVLNSLGRASEQAAINVVSTVADLTRTLDKSLEYKESSDTYTSFEMTWTPLPVGSSVSLERAEGGVNNGTGTVGSWQTVATGLSGGAYKVTGLAANKFYKFRLNVTGGSAAGYSNEISFYSGKLSAADFGVSTGANAATNKANINKAIAWLNSIGGGVLSFPGNGNNQSPSTYATQTIYLKSNVYLYMETGAMLQAQSGQMDDPESAWWHYYDYGSGTNSSSDPYDNPDNFLSKQDDGHCYFQNAMFYARREDNMKIIGTGRLNGNGALATGDGTVRNAGGSRADDMISLKLCTNFELGGKNIGKDMMYDLSKPYVYIGNDNAQNTYPYYPGETGLSNCLFIDRGGHFVLLATGSDNINIHDTIYQRYNRGNARDVYDLMACNNVKGTNIFAGSTSDDIVKLGSDCSLGFTRPVSNHEYRNIIGDTNCNNFQIGSETADDIQDVWVDNLVVLGANKAGFSISTNDGAYVRNINLNSGKTGVVYGAGGSGSHFERTRTPIFISISHRGRIIGAENRTVGGQRVITNVPIGIIDGVTMKDVDITEVYSGSTYNKSNIADFRPYNPSSHTEFTSVVVGYKMPAGTPNMPDGRMTGYVKNVTFDNVNILMKGGGTAADRSLTCNELNVGQYNSPDMGKRPSYGLYIRHTDNFTFKNSKLIFEGNDDRFAIVLDDVLSSKMENVVVDKGSSVADLIQTRNSLVDIADMKYTAGPQGTSEIAVPDVNGFGGLNVTKAYPTSYITDPDTDPGNPEDLPVTGVMLNKYSLSLQKGGAETLIAGLIPANTLRTGVKWSTDNARVADIYNGIVTATGAGTATVTVTTDDGAKTAACVVTVANAVVNPSSVSVSRKETTLAVGETGLLGSVVTPGFADVTGTSWESSDPAVAAVSHNGLLTAKAAGTAVITVKVTSGGADVTDTCRVTVSNSLAPFNLHNPREAVSYDACTLLWDKASNLYTSDLQEYIVYKDGAEIGRTVNMGYSVTGLAPGKSYNFRVDALHKGGETDPGPTVSVTTKPEPAAILDVTKQPYNAVGDGGWTNPQAGYKGTTAASNYNTPVSQTTGTLNTSAIQRAINDCPPGGVVYIPQGVFLSAPLFLKSDMTLKIDGTLLATTDLTLYPKITSMFEGWEILETYASLLTIGTLDTFGPYNIHDVTVCGTGRVDASGLALDFLQGGTGNSSTSNPQLRTRGRAVVVHNARNVYFRDLDIGFGPSWTLHAIVSDHLTYDNLVIQGKLNGTSNTVASSASPQGGMRVRNGDGIGSDSCTNVNIFNSVFHSGDDSITIKSGKNDSGWRRNKPTEGVRVTNCVLPQSQGGIVIGSEMSGGVGNVLVQDNDIANDGWEAFDIKSDVGRGGIVSNIVVKDLRIAGARLAGRISFKYSTNNDGDKAPVPPAVDGVLFENFTGNTTAGFEIIGLPASKIANVAIVNCNITAGNKTYDDYDTVSCKGYIQDCRDFLIRNVVFTSTAKPWGIVESERIDVDRSLIVNAPNAASTDIKVKTGASVVSAVSNTAPKSVTVSGGGTVNAVIADITSGDGSVQSYAIKNSEGTAKPGTAAVATGDVLVVTSEDESAEAEYGIIVTVVFDPVMFAITSATAKTNSANASVTNASDSSAQGGSYQQMPRNSNGTTNAVGEWVQYAVNVPTAGMYTVEFGFKYNSNGRGAFQMSVDGVNLGDPIDENVGGATSGAAAFHPAVVGNVSLTAGSHDFRMTVTRADNLVFDYIRLIPVVNNV